MSRPRPADAALEARLAARMIGVLSAAQPPLAPDLAERLRFARQTALGRARGLRPAVEAQPARAAAGGLVLAGSGPSLGHSLGDTHSWWPRLASLLPLLVLIAGLVGIDHWVTAERIATAADIDAALLSDKLPPEAYTDPGFAEFLRSEPGSGVLPEAAADTAAPET